MPGGSSPHSGGLSPPFPTALSGARAPASCRQVPIPRAGETPGIPGRSMWWCSSKKTSVKRSGEVVDHAFSAVGLESLLDKLEVRWMHLIIILILLVRKDQVERDLIRLLHDRPVARNHLSDVKGLHAGDRFEKFLRARNDFSGGIGSLRFCPKNDDV